jgi:hypothetical protein
MADDWSYDDAWLLAALSHSRRPGLRTTIATMDMLNVDVPTYQRFADAAARLAAAEYAERRGHGLRLTGRGDALVREARRGVRGMREVPPRVLMLLQREPVPECPADGVVSPGEFEDAVAQYLQPRRKALAFLRRS